MGKWAGKLTELGKLADYVGQLQQVPSRVSRAMADGIEPLIVEAIDSETDPYGVPWDALATATVKKKGHAQIMYETGRLRDAVSVTPRRGAGVEMSIARDYSGFHQTGFAVVPESAFHTDVHVAPRKLLPDGDELPPAWQAVIDEVMTKAFGEPPNAK